MRSSPTRVRDAYEKLVDRLLAERRLRRALGADVARPGPLRRLGRLRQRPAADDLALPRLRDPLVQRRTSRSTSSPSSRSPATCCPTRPTSSSSPPAFHRNTMTNSEGGTNDEEFRNAAIIDRVNTTMTVWMGTTIACCQCHDHKYDPLTQQGVFPAFRDLQQHRRRRPGRRVAAAQLSTPTSRRSKRTKLEAEIAAVEAKFKEDTPTLAAGQAAWEQRGGRRAAGVDGAHARQRWNRPAARR